jgi:hypothetical protein
MKRDRQQRDHPTVHVAAFRHFRLIGAVLKNFYFPYFYFLKNS